MQLLRRIWPLLASNIFMLGISVLCMATLSAMRAYVGGESLWSKAQKEAVTHLRQFTRNGDPSEFTQFRDALAIPLGDRRARIELQKPSPDLSVAYAGFLAGGNHPEDIPSMIRLFRVAGWTPYMRHAIQVWTQGDALISQLDATANQLMDRGPAGRLDSLGHAVLQAQVDRIDFALRPLEDEFSETLGFASRTTTVILEWSEAISAALFLAIGVVLTRSIMRRADAVEQALRASERRVSSERERARVSLQRQAQQHSLLASFGQFALENPPPGELVTRAVQVLRQGLNAELCRFLEAGPDHRVLIHAAGTGWADAWLCESLFDAVAEMEDRFVFGTREAIVVTDFESEVRFKRSPILQAHAVRSAVEALVCGASGPYGMLGAYAREAGRFDADSANFARSVAHTLAAATVRRNAEEQLAYMAQFDALTGLPNRSLYLDRLGQTLVEAERDKRPVGVLFVDIDRFKNVNDTLGHGVGDLLLATVANRLRSAVRAGDTVGRLGGDEFTVTLAHLARDDDSGRVAKKIVDALGTPFELGEHKVYVSASVGISVYPADGREPDTLLKNADMAMYRAKESGRNCYQFYLAQMNERAIARMRIESELRGALDRGEFLLYYQPRIDSASGRISGLEALLRWKPMDRDLVLPDEFIPTLEDTGLIVAVGQWVVTSVCAQIGRWQADGLGPPPVAVNLSARQFRQSNLDTVIAEVLATSSLDPGLLELELTESTLMRDSEAAVQALQRIKARGVRVVVDDFGTGFSSLSYLRRFPLDALKIDRAFVRDVTTKADDAAIVAAIISLARSLKLRVIAEGVEMESQAAFLRAHGCDEMQGYYFAPPLPVDQVTSALREDRRIGAAIASQSISPLTA